MKKAPNPLAPFLQEPFNAKNAQNCQMHLFPPTRSIMKKFFWACSQKINSLGETGTKFSYCVKVQDLKTCKSKYLATWFSAFCLVTFDTCHVTHSCRLKKST